MDARQIAEWLALRGVQLSMRERNGAISYWPESGFYKSDGCAYIVDGSNGPELHARYGEKDEISDPWDVVRASMDWHERSKNRFSGWLDPADEWAVLYINAGDPIPYRLTEAGKAMAGKGGGA